MLQDLEDPTVKGPWVSWPLQLVGKSQLVDGLGGCSPTGGPTNVRATTGEW